MDWLHLINFVSIRRLLWIAQNKSVSIGQLLWTTANILCLFWECSGYHVSFTAVALLIQNISDEGSPSIIYLISALMIHSFIQPPLLMHKKWSLCRNNKINQMKKVLRNKLINNQSFDKQTNNCEYQMYSANIKLILFTNERLHSPDLT